MPGQTLLIAGALEAAKGRINLACAFLLVVSAAAMIGNSTGYAISRWGGRAVSKNSHIDSRRQKRLDDIFERWGGVVIILARFVDGLRWLNGVAAGIMDIPWWTFTVYNVAGVLFWTCAWGLGSYYLGRDIQDIAAFFHRHRWMLYGLSATVILVLVAALIRYRSAEGESVIHHRQYSHYFLFGSTIE